jgi:hypothetical protein
MMIVPARKLVAKSLRIMSALRFRYAPSVYPYLYYEWRRSQVQTTRTPGLADGSQRLVETTWRELAWPAAPPGLDTKRARPSTNSRTASLFKKHPAWAGVSGIPRAGSQCASERLRTSPAPQAASSWSSLGQASCRNRT